MAVIIRPICESDGKLKISNGNSAGHGSSSLSFDKVVIMVWLIMVEKGTGKWDRIRPTALNH